MEGPNNFISNMKEESRLKQDELDGVLGDIGNLKNEPGKEKELEDLNIRAQELAEYIRGLEDNIQKMEKGQK